MLSYLGKRLAWVLTSVVALVGGMVALAISKGVVVGKGAAAHTTATVDPQWSAFWPHHHPAPVPEVNTGLVLLPIALAIMLFSSQHLWRRQRQGNR